MQVNKELSWVTVLLTVVCSCISPIQELSSYWDGHDFQTLDAFDDIDAAEDKFDRYIKLLNKVPKEAAATELMEFMDSAAQNEVAYMVWASWFEPYLHSLESPYRNDTLFEVWLNRVLEDDILDDYTKERLQKTKNVLKRNVAGRLAADVVLIDSEGVEFRISDLKGQRVLLMLLDADCPSCLDYLNENLVEYGHTTIRMIAVLVNGSHAHVQQISSRLSAEVLARWKLAWCPGREVERGLVYDLDLIPSRILLDKENIVEQSYY